jgi:hypothetical protein
MRRSILAICSAVVLASYPVVAQQMPKQRSSGPDADPRPARSYPRVPQRATTDAPQVRHAMRETVNGGLVGIISGSMDATDLGKATDLAIGLGTEGGRLRPLLIIGEVPYSTSPISSSPEASISGSSNRTCSPR